MNKQDVINMTPSQREAKLPVGNEDLTTFLRMNRKDRRRWAKRHPERFERLGLKR